MRQPMFGHLAGAALAAAVTVAASAAAARPETFTALENRLSDALARYDAATVGELWDQRFVFVFPDGHVSHRAERLAALAKGPPPGPAGLTSHNDAVDVQYEDPRLAVVTVRSVWRSTPTDPGDAYLATHVWVRHGRVWRLLSAQVAHIGK